MFHISVSHRVAGHQPVAKRTEESYRECRKTGPMEKDPEAVLLTEGNRLFLTCQICLKPSENSRGIWKRVPPDVATFVPVELDGRRSRVLIDLSLEIVNIREKDSGVYFCFMGTKVMAKYAVDVVQEEPHRYVCITLPSYFTFKQIIVSGRKLKRGPSKAVPMKDFNLVLRWNWSEWSECSRCGSVGKRRRVGICTVKKMNLVSPAKPVDTQILKEYRDGLPCRSSLLPKAIRELPKIQSAKSEFMIGFCKIPCRPDASIAVITDKTGAVVDTVDNSQGVYSMHQPLPKLPALAKRTTVYEELGSSIMMTCPGQVVSQNCSIRISLFRNTIIYNIRDTQGKFLRWRNNSYVINPSKVHVKTKGRVKIDIGNNLHIRKLQSTDAAIYSSAFLAAFPNARRDSFNVLSDLAMMSMSSACWDDKILVGTVRLEVLAQSMGRSYRANVLHLGLLLTFFTICAVARTVCINAKLETKD
ncbi:uncharacterized protein CDAR_178321 [Caerostris darwini]|uniref:Ig-like domain-containing protein n=1 Tax=Caerostris darwini TaxID=1538125 RepID=A0AAV4PH39_9ARAC|nr:uncharacterized protein CDAR_178321 [Caerostris darwini]